MRWEKHTNLPTPWLTPYSRHELEVGVVPSPAQGVVGHAGDALMPFVRPRSRPIPDKRGNQGGRGSEPLRRMNCDPPLPPFPSLRAPMKE